VPLTVHELVSEITGLIPDYSALKARRDLSRAWRDLLDKRTWSFLVAEGTVTAPPLITAGTVTLTQGSPTVVPDATAAAAWAAVPQASLLQRQFRVAAEGGIYNIVGWTTPTGPLTLDRPVVEASGTGLGYRLFQCYFLPPAEALVNTLPGEFDFNRWLSVLDPINGIELKLDRSKAWLDVRDPQRAAGDLAYYIADYAPTVTGVPRYEFWPHPTGGQTFICLYKRQGLPFTQGTQALPQMLPDGLLLNRALYRSAYPWAAANAGRFPALQRTNWQYLIREARGDYLLDLQAAKLQDDNVYLQSMVGPKRLWPAFGPVDSKFLQSHSMGSEYYWWR
jgi:hypothetical protein